MSISQDPVEQLDETLDAPQADEHRFKSEPKRPKGGKRLLIVVASVATFLSIVGAAGYFAKAAWTSHMSSKSETKRVEQEKTAVPAVRKGKTFATEEPSTPAENDAALALPQGFRQGSPGHHAASTTQPIPLAGPTGMAPAPAGRPGSAPPPKPKPSMMLADPEPAEATRAAEPLLTGSTPLPTSPAPALAPAPASAISGPRKAGSVQELAQEQALKAPPTSSPQSSAAKLGERSLLLARGAFLPCVLETDLNSNVPGPTSCIITANVYSDDGKVVLIEKGSRALGEYRNTLKQGDTRLAVLWSRIKTPNGVVVDVDSPAAEGTGAAGVSGEIDNHWMQRIGAAFLLSFVQDAIAATTKEKQESGTTVINTSNTSKSMAEKVLESTINIPPTLSRNRGERLMIVVNRDLWFDAVYSLRVRP